MAYDRWDEDDTYRPRRYGNDSDYERNFWRDSESRGRGSADEDRRSRYASLPVFGLDYGNPRRYPDRDRWERERYGSNRDRDEWSGRNYGDEWSRRDYGNEWTGRDYGSDWSRRDRGMDRGMDWSRREPGDWGRRARGERSWWDRTKDEVRSWLGDEDAEHRREADHRGRGPRGYTRSDDRIREDVSDWLMEDAYVDASDIEVVVVAGEVTLTGTVDSRDMKWRAENLAADVLGVRDVHNRLRTRSRQTYGTTPSETTGAASSQASSAATGGMASGTTNASTTPRH
jgi:osmotically-inducible protein OsmY